MGMAERRKLDEEVAAVVSGIDIAVRDDETGRGSKYRPGGLGVGEEREWKEDEVGGGSLFLNESLSHVGPGGTGKGGALGRDSWKVQQAGWDV